MPDAEARDANPLTSGLSRTLLPDPCTLVIFGGAGDLSRRKLLPAVWNLLLDGVLPSSYAVVGFARTDHDDESFRELATESIAKHSRRPAEPALFEEFLRHLFWVRGGFDDPAAYVALSERLEKIEPALGLTGNRVHYLSVPPSAMGTCVGHLQTAGLTTPTEGRAFTRIIIEKPIGHDLASARALNAECARVFDESQIYRIDHYLGKETVQNLMVMRFANAIFEPLWNQKYVDHVQITVAETEGVGTRAGYYEESGALRDMVQNHILQLLCLTAMEPPWSLSGEVVRDHKLAVLNCLRPIDVREVERHVVRAQYAAGFHAGIEVPGYRNEDRVRPDSRTETYVAVKCFVDNWRWSGVPFYLRTGKRLPKRASEIAVQFKEVPPILFNADADSPLEPNVLALRIQPDEGLSLRIATKLPGPKVRVYPVKMDFRYGATFGEQTPEAYERLLLDVMAGDATLFMRRDAVEAAWRWVDGVLEGWKAQNLRWLPQYGAGTWGPVEADRLIEADGRKWRTL
ncbi:MAG TPA: glucose-6-phosphate dehydrogenase [Myxococcota bacterium]|jgi:glucose-6-phosphate 1-dehydrogenase|nr:glucose-6-phosphate dehydrogenase [Myxococcota bacterium]